MIGCNYRVDSGFTSLLANRLVTTGTEQPVQPTDTAMHWLMGLHQHTALRVMSGALVALDTLASTCVSFRHGVT
jgi:hypothetical protein